MKNTIAPKMMFAIRFEMTAPSKRAPLKIDRRTTGSFTRFSIRMNAIRSAAAAPK